ncbi:hypothetical protein PHMEG_00041772 [Phytophthora megakarya]|uniref:Uncharacterized protein n=1 Tax=Phytophthora megakarya TaxID=4795 RepID=A0A225UB41_9STRA|nr:hypothetical protein PHMEG_00041772 [Phytophthora megakarya]
MELYCNELRLREGEQTVVIPFRTYTNDGEVKITAVRIVSRMQMTKRAVTPIQVAVAASEDEHGIFVSTKNKSVVMLAATLTTVENGKVLHQRDYPRKESWGEWIPLAESMTVLVMHDVNIGLVDSETWLLMIKMIKMVQVYRKLTKLG